MRLGTRASALALAQARLVAGLIGDCEIVEVSTAGDRGAGPGDKSRWVGELERALSAGEVDVAVHSAKDLPGEQAEGLCILGAPPRASAEDVICGAPSLPGLREGARVGTSSLRRAAQLRAAREDLEVVALRGNVDTRLRRLGEPERGLDAIVLAAAGLQRLGRAREAGGTLDPARFVPAPGQGVIALQGRADDAAAREAALRASDVVTLACLTAERALARELGASCHTPLGAHAQVHGSSGLRLHAWVGLPDGSAWIADELDGDAADPEALGAQLAGRLRSVGAGELLARAEEMAVA